MKKIATILLCLVSAFTIQAQSKKILIVMSAARELPLANGKIYANTGVFLSEFYLAYADLTNLDYTFDFATPGGKTPKIDNESFNKKYWKNRDSLITKATEFVRVNTQFNNPLNLEEAYRNLDQYDGMIVPGGQGLMVDLVEDTLVRRIITAFAEKQKCVGLICHAPALLTSYTQKDNPFRGYKVNSVTALEEFFIEKFVMKGRPFNRKIGKQLKRSGFTYVKGGPGKNFAVRDRNLVTSQNPFSNEAFIKNYLEALSEQSRIK
jgi:putative intracellular protease/amidase